MDKHVAALVAATKYGRALGCAHLPRGAIFRGSAAAIALEASSRARVRRFLVLSASHIQRLSRTRFLLHLAFALLGVAAIVAVSAPSNSGDVAHASQGLSYAPGYSVQHGWLCYGWSNGAYHCTQQWFRNSAGQLVSGNPAWVPNTQQTTAATGGAGAAPVATQGFTQAANNRGEPCQSGIYWNGVPSSWVVPASCYGNTYAINPANYVYRPYFGMCNWWPEVMNPGVANPVYGNWPRSWSPIVGSTVAFAPGVQGAGGTGHYGRVIAIYPGGYWFLISEMDFYFDGGGWGRVSYRYAHTGPGVSFIYYP